MFNKCDTLYSSQCVGPGGYLIVRESDLVIYNHEHPPPPKSEVLNPAVYMQGTSVLANANRIFAGGALQLGFVVGCVRSGLVTSRATLTEESGFRIVFPQCSRKLPCGLYLPSAPWSLSETTAMSRRA
jgi:hypothetical protein